jgi:hypothetical protein
MKISERIAAILETRRGQPSTGKRHHAASGLNCPRLEHPPEVGQTSKGFMKKYKTEFKLKVPKSFLTGNGGAKLLVQR